MRDEYLPAATETIGLDALPGGDGIYAAEILAGPPSRSNPPVHGSAPSTSSHRGGAPAVAAELGSRARPRRSPRTSERGQHRGGARRARRRRGAGRRAGRRRHRTSAGAGGELRVRAVEEFREADMPFAFYHPPTEDGSRAGIYYVNAYDLEDRPLHHLATTTYHEANPGHHFQIALEQEMADRPALRRFGGCSRARRSRGLGPVQRAPGGRDGAHPRREHLGCSRDRGSGRPASSPTPGSTRSDGPGSGRSRSRTPGCRQRRRDRDRPVRHACRGRRSPT